MNIQKEKLPTMPAIKQLNKTEDEIVLEIAKLKKLLEKLRNSIIIPEINKVIINLEKTIAQYQNKRKEIQLAFLTENGTKKYCSKCKYFFYPDQILLIYTEETRTIKQHYVDDEYKVQKISSVCRRCYDEIKNRKYDLFVKAEIRKENFLWIYKKGRWWKFKNLNNTKNIKIETQIELSESDISIGDQIKFNLKKLDINAFLTDLNVIIKSKNNKKQILL